MPSPPATIADVGGGAGAHALWLARRGYDVHLLDPVAAHVEQARTASKAADAPLASIELGHAQSLPYGDASVDCVLLFGPLYHLPERAARVEAVREARRVLRPGGLLAAIAISRFAFLLDGVATERAFAPGRLDTIRGSVATGSVDGTFASSWLHRPGELADELADGGFTVEELLGVEGPGWLLGRFGEAWRDEEQRRTLLELAAIVEAERDLVAASTHMIAFARRASA